MTKLPKQHRGKLIHTASDMNTSEDMESHRDMAEGNAVLERYKQKKKENEQNHVGINESNVHVEEWKKFGR